MTMPKIDVNITNVGSITPESLSLWINNEILNFNLQEVDANSTVDGVSSVKLMPQIANKLMTVTGLYVHLVAAKPQWQKAKKEKTDDSADTIICYLNAKIDMLYRVIQTLETVQSVSSRVMTGIGSIGKMSR